MIEEDTFLKKFQMRSSLEAFWNWPTEHAHTTEYNIYLMRFQRSSRLGKVSLRRINLALLTISCEHVTTRVTVQIITKVTNLNLLHQTRLWKDCIDNIPTVPKTRFHRRWSFVQEVDLSFAKSNQYQVFEFKSSIFYS